MTLYVKCLIASLLLIFWSVHHSINIAAFIKPTAVVNQFNNAAILSFGSMVSILSPLVLKVFAKKRLKLPDIEISAIFGEIRESAASGEFQESNKELRGSIAAKEFRKTDRSENLKKSVDSSELDESAASGEFSEMVACGEFGEMVASGEFKENVAFEEIRVRDMRRSAFCLLDIMNVNKIMPRENYDSGEFRESVDSEEIGGKDIRNIRRHTSCPLDLMNVNKTVLRENYDSEEFRKNSNSAEFRKSAASDEFYKDIVLERYIRNMRRPASCPMDFMTNKMVLRKNYDSEEFRERLILKSLEKVQSLQKLVKMLFWKNFK